MVDHNAIRLALRNRLLTVAGLPDATNQALSNRQFTPTALTPYIEEDYVPASAGLVTTAVNGVIQVTGLYVIRWYGIENTGELAVRQGTDAILAVFPPSFGFPALGNGDELRVRGDVAPYSGQVVPSGDGWAACAVTIPWRCLSRNV
jgi:hypothetical protein